MLAHDLKKFVFLACFSCLFASMGWANSAPTNITASNLTIEENSAIGTVIGEFNATDPDGDTNITFSILNDSGSEMGWTSSRLFGDSDSGVSSDLNYTCAVNVNGSNKVVNGVTFLGSSGTSGDGWAITAGFGSKHDGENSSVGGEVGQMISNGFRYDGNPQKIKMTGLTVGRNYIFSLYNQGWNGGTSRSCYVSCSALSGSTLINEDKYGDQNPDGHLVRCFYTANAQEVEFTFNRPIDGGSWHLYAFSNHEGVPFALDDNGTLTTLKSLDYETDDRNYSITVRATDDHNASFDKNFTITVANVVEDLDGDGIEDHNDTDIDGDGLTNAEELLYNSDPRDASSSNRPPSDINASNLTIAENSAIGTVIGEFNATDPDGEGNFTFSIIPYPPRLWLDVADVSSVVHVDGNLSRWKNKVSSQHDAVLQSGTVNYLPGGLDGSLPTIDTTSGELRVLDSNLSFDEWEKLTISMAFKWTSRGVWDGTLWKSNNHTSSTSGYSIAKMNTNNNQNTGLWYGISSGSQRIIGSIATEAMFEPKVLTFICDGSSGSVELFSNGVIVNSASNFPQKILQAREYDLKIGGDHLFSEILIYEDALDSTERGGLESYLMGKWLPRHKGFSVDQNGTLRTTSIFDYETDDQNYTVTVWATDDHNISFDKNFTITVTNVVEDLDGDSIEDHNDTDIDGDGLSNIQELAYNSDPWDASSSNRPPSDINASNLTIAENSAIGTLIGEFNATDPDGDTNITLSLPSRPIFTSLDKLQVWLDASQPEQLSTSLTESIPPTSGNQIKKWLDLSGSGHHAEALAGTPTWSENSFNTKPGVVLNKASLVLNNSRTAFDGWNELTVVAAFFQPGDQNFATLFGKSNYAGWLDNSKDLAWSVFTHRLDLSHNLWGPAIISDTPGNIYLHSNDSKAFQKQESGAPGILVLSYNSGQTTLKVNGQEIASSGALSGSIQSKPGLDVTIGGHSNPFIDTSPESSDQADKNVGGLNNMVISEFMIFNDDLSVDNDQKIEGYLAHKWNVDALLPQDHTFKFDQPFYNNNHLFTFDENGTLTANQTFDYETDDRNYTVTVRATDQSGASFDKSFTLNIANVVEDLDGDGTEDFYDDDIDGDGLTNAEELAYNSDPWDASSSNRPPSDINASNLTIAENSAIGTIIGEFNATDPDGDTNITLSLVFPIPSKESLSLWLDASELTSADSLWLDKSGNGNDASKFGSPSVITGVQNGHSVMRYAGIDGQYHSWDSLEDIRTVFWVVRKIGTSRTCFLLGDSTNFHFHSQANNYFWANGVGARHGITRENGQLIDPTVTPFPSTLSVVSFVSEYDMVASSFSNDRNIAGRTWIGDLGELLIFNKSLSKIQISQVEAFLAYKWGLESHLPSNHHSGTFSVDGNGTLTTNRTFDYESESNYSITVQATDDLNASSTHTFTVQITNVVEDLDGDGTEDPFDDDIDGDGVSNANEILYSSDPLDAGSTNPPPFSFSSSSLTVAENSSIGAVVGEFNGTSSNSDGNFTFRILPDAPDGFSPLLWLDAADPFTLYSEVNRTSYALSGAVAGWADKSGRGQHFGQSTSSARPSTGNRMFNGLNVLDFNGAQWMKSNADFATGTDFTFYMFAKIDVVNHINDSLFCLTTNDPDFQIHAGHSTQFLARYTDSGMGGAKTFASTAQHQAVVWSISFSGDRHRKVNISVNGISLSGSSDYTTHPKQSSNSLNIFSNRGQDSFPEGFVGEFIVVNNMDYPGGGGVQEYLQRKWLGETYDNDPFVLDSNGTLLTNRILDFEADEQNQTFQIIASTGTTQSIPQEFIVSITDVEEDLDGDGVEDFYDSDSDGDGLSNLQEFLGHSDPLNSSSNNAAPSEINATTSLSFSESLALGSIAVDFNATDTNSDANLTYRVQPKIDISEVPGISGWFDASDLDSLTTDLSGNKVLSWANKSNSAVKLKVNSKPPTFGAHINGLHAVYFDKNESLISMSGNSLWNPWTRDGSLAGQFKDGAFFIVVRFLEHGRFGFPNLGNHWSGTFPWTNCDFHWDIWRNAEVNRIWGPLTGIEDNLLLTLNHSVTNSVRYFSKNGNITSSGTPIITNNYGPIIFPNINNEPSYIVGETIFVREFLNEANREKIEGYLTHKWGLADQLPTDHPYAGIDFTIDENGSLRTAREFDYESDDHNYSVRIWATDEHNASTHEDFTLTLTNVVEDLDGDGTEDYYDDDIDGDGLTNDEELAYNSDPWDASSSNRPPSDINASNLIIAENSAVGTVIGEFNATDPDGEGNFTFAIHFDSLAIWLPFDETNGTTTQNYGSFSTSVSLVGDANFSSSEKKFGSSSLRVPISSPNARVELSTPIALGNGGASNPYSVSAWFKGLYAFSETVHGWRTLIRGSTNNHHIIINKESDEIGIHRDAWFGSGKILSPISSDSNWQHLVATFDGSKTTFYIDGNLLGSVQISPGLDIKSIGNYWGGNQHFAEYLDDFRVYTKVLSQSEISSLYHFSVDQNGTLTANQPFDYETFDQNQTLVVRAFDDHNATFDKNFTITVTNVVEDLDGDGTEDHYDDDIDGDGLTNAEELAYNSDPWDASSSNRPPSDINASNLTIAENSAIGTVIGEFNATDPDGDGNFTYSFTPPGFEDFSPLLWLDANDRSTITGISQVSQWKDKSGNNFHANQSNLEYKPKIIEQNGNSLIRFDGTNDLMDVGTILSTTSEIEVFLVAHKEASDGETFQRIISSFGSGSSNDWTAPNWHIHKYALPSGITSSFGNRLFNHTYLSHKIQNLRIGAYATKSVDYYKGDIAELIVFRQVLTAGDKQRVQGYLAHKWGFVDSLTVGHPFKFDRFSLDENGTLTTNQSFDYETDDLNYSITVRATDDHNISFDKNFTITLTNVVEDFDGDGTEDHYDDDIDGDGLTNAEELAYNSDPWDASSINRPPSDINASNLTIAENSAIGTVIGEFNATDPDGEGNFTFLLAGESLPFGWTSTHLTGDEDSGVSSGYNYTCSVNVNGSNKTVNGVTFIGSTATSGSGWEITGGFSSTYNGENSTVGGQIGSLLSDGFRFDGNPQKLKLTGLTVGRIYVFSLYNQAWGAGTSRISKISSTFFEEVVSINQDKFGGQSQDGHLVRCKYTANASEVEFSLTRDGSGGSWHLYAFSNHEVIPFALDENGTLSTLKSFDYETDDRNFTITVRATDDHNVSFDKNFTISVTNVVEDLDGDGTEDHYDDDIDGDGFTNTDELAYGSDPLDNNSVANAAPLELNASNVLTISENQPVGTRVGQLIGHDPDTNSTLVFSFVDGNGSDDNSLFVIDENASVRTTTIFDYETDDHNYSIRVKVADEHNFSIERSFTINLLNIVEDNDQDGVEDHYDQDDDNDGFSDADELAYGSDPLDPSSVANAAPNSLDLNGTTILENQPTGTRVGQLSGHDPDTNATLVFSFVDGNGSDDNSLFEIDENASVRSTTIFDYESDEHNYSIRVRVADEHNFSIEKSFTINLLNIVEDNDQDGVEDHYDLDDDNDGFSDADELAYGSDPLDPNSVANAAPNSLDLNGTTILENQSAGTIIGRLIGHDPDTNATLIYSQILDGNQTQSPVYVGPAGVVRSTRIFDYETNDHNYTLVARVSDEHNFSIERSFTIQLLDQNEPPFDLNISTSLRVLENQPVGTVVGKLTANDQDEGEHLFYSLVRDRDPIANEFFTLDENGTLRTAEVLDFEKNASLFIRARVTDKGGLLTKNGFVVEVINVVEDNDQDGVEDHYDLDDDNDGFSDTDEIAYGSDPMDSSSVANASPDFLELNGTTILENQPAGTIIGRLIGHDPDANATLVYSQVLEGNQTQSPIYVGPAGVVRSTRVFDYETSENNYTLVARVADEHNFSIERSFTIQLLNLIEDMDKDGVEDHLDGDIDGDGFSNEEEIAYGSNPRDAQSVINAAPTDITMQGGAIEENQAAGSLVARFIGVDADKNDSLTYQLVDPIAEDGFPFKLSQRGGLRTTRKLDYELDPQDYSLTVRVVDDLNESFEKSFIVYLHNQIEDLDGDGIEDFYDEDIDGDGYTNEQEIEEGTNPRDRYSYSNKPILRTRMGVLNEDGSIDLSGSVIEDGQGEITDFGFVISSRISIDPQQSTVYWVRGVGEPEGFKLTVTESPFEQVMYFRAWAKNVAGYGIGPVKKVVIPEAPKPWWGTVEEMAGGWKTSEWFGTFRYYEQGWLYHARLGWLYSSPAKENSVWLWKEDKGWLWTKGNIWPYLWWHRTGNWLYLVPGKEAEPVRLFDYSTQSYQ